jgi:sialic acid synthase SpsE
MSKNLNIGDICIGSDLPAHVIAEVGANHNGSHKIASQMLEAIAKSGTKIVKFQYYTTKEVISDPERVVNYGPPGNQVRVTVGEMFDKISLEGELLKELIIEAKALGLVTIVTPFSEKGADFIANLDVDAIKVASSDVNHLPLLSHIAMMGKPVLISMGKSTLAEVDEAISTLENSGCKKIGILHCVASYPSPMNEMNLKIIPSLADIYPEYAIGFSDHSLGLTAAISAVSIGACLVEKHVTLSREFPGPDHWFSIEMEELRELTQAVKDVHAAMGTSRKKVTHSETLGRERGIRSLVATRDLPSGHILAHGDLKAVRPGGGIPPKYMNIVSGMRLKKPLKAETILKWDYFQED